MDGSLVFPTIVTSRVLFNDLKKLFFKLDRETHHLEFLRACKRLSIVPKFLRTSSRYHSSVFAKEKRAYELRCLASCVRRKFGVIARISEQIYGRKNDGIYYKFSQSCSAYEFDSSIKRIAAYRETLAEELILRHERKLLSLTQGLLQPDRNKTPEGFLNLSSRMFKECEIDLLNRGPKYICSSVPKIVDIIPQLEEVVRAAPFNMQDEVRGYVFQETKKVFNRKHFVPNEVKIVRELKGYQDIVIVPTDKSNRVAVLNRPEYISKVNDAISKMSCSVVNSDPLNSFCNKVNKLKNASWPNEVKSLRKVNPVGIIPHLFGVVKDHKPGFPLRPIVSRCQAPSYFLEKVLATILKDLLPPSTRVLKSTNDFIQRLDGFQVPPDFIMASMDIVSLYPSIDMNRTRDIIARRLVSNTDLPANQRSTIISAINLLISNNYFQFNGQIYEQQKGTPMGSPVSGVFAEFVVREVEEDFLSNSSVQPALWLRYVDDVFIIWTCTDNDLDMFFNNLNSVDKDIKFTCEKETNGSIAYLDVLLTKKNDVLSRSVYRKPMNNCSTISNQACAPVPYKKAAYRSYIRRAFMVCTQDTIHNELEIIRKIAIDNGYGFSFVNDLIHEYMKVLPRSRSNALAIPSSSIGPHPSTLQPGNLASSVVSSISQPTMVIHPPTQASGNTVQQQACIASASCIISSSFPVQNICTQSTSDTSIKPSRRIAIDYVPGFHERLSRYMRKFNVQLTAKTFPKLSYSLKTKIDSIPMDSKPGVYEIPIHLPDGSLKHYIGQTGRRLKDRVIEHQRNIRKQERCSALSRTYLDNPGSHINFDDARIIAPYTSKSRSTMRESVEIFSRKNNVCNEQDSKSIPRIWKSLIV